MKSVAQLTPVNYFGTPYLFDCITVKIFYVKLSIKIMENLASI